MVWLKSWLVNPLLDGDGDLVVCMYMLAKYILTRDMVGTVGQINNTLVRTVRVQGGWGGGSSRRPLCNER